MPPLPLDQAILAWFRARWTPPVDRFLLDVTSLGGRNVLALFVIFSLGLLLCVRRYLTATFLVAAVVGGAMLSQMTKGLTERPRPSHPHVLVRRETSYSFPSGHSTLSAATYLTLALIVAQVAPMRRVRVYLISAAAVLVFLVGLSRMYLNVHYPTDVLGGWGIGTTWALLCHWVEARWVLRAEHRALASGKMG